MYHDTCSSSSAVSLYTPTHTVVVTKESEETFLINAIDEPLVLGKPIEDTSPDKKTTDVQARTMRTAFFTMFPMFMGYAALVTLQSNIKDRLHIGDNGSSASYQFSFAVSLLYLGNLVFRLMHNVLFCLLRPRHRVVIAYCCMMFSTALLPVAYYFAASQHVLWVYVAYLFGGVAIGTFESNLISVLTPLGHGTKVWAQLGIPIGFNGISVGAFALFAVFPSCIDLQAAVYCFISVSNLLGLLFFVLVIPDVHFESSHRTFKDFVSDMAHFREWVPLIGAHSFSLAVDMFAVSLGAAIQLYIYDMSHVPLWHGSSATVPVDVFRAIFNSCSLIGDATGRKLAYHTKRHVMPIWFLIFTCCGIGLILSKQGIMAPLGMLFVMFANGSIYAHTTKYVDDKVHHRFNLVALSIWLFVGDIGSFAGANLVNAVRVAVGCA